MIGEQEQKNIKLWNYYDNGFSTPYVLITIFCISVVILALLGFISSGTKQIATIDNVYKVKAEQEAIIRNIVNDFQELTELEHDTPENDIITNIKRKYYCYNLSINDVSTGINELFLKKEYLNNTKVVKLIKNYDTAVLSNYGWINKDLVDVDLLSEIKEDFSAYNITELFPLINQMPLYNIYFMNIDFLEAILDICEIKDSRKQAELLYEQIKYSDFENIKIQEVLNLTSNSLLCKFLGYKTTFWQICFEMNGYEIKVILAAVPDKINKNNISKYELINKEIIKR